MTFKFCLDHTEPIFADLKILNLHKLSVTTHVNLYFGILIFKICQKFLLIIFDEQRYTQL